MASWVVTAVTRPAAAPALRPRPRGSGRRSARPAARLHPRATDAEGNGAPHENISISVVFVRPSEDDPTAVIETTCVAETGENLLAAAMRCGAVSTTSTFCLEGRCDSCLFENRTTGETLRGCQTALDGTLANTRLWKPGDDDAFALDDDW